MTDPLDPEPGASAEPVAPEGLDPQRADALLRELSDADFAGEIGALERAGAPAVPLLLALAQRATSGARRKQIRAALHRLRSRGIAEADLTRAPRRAVVGPVTPVREPAYLTAPHLGGSSVVLLAERHEDGGAIYTVWLEDGLGVSALRGGTGSWREVRGALRGVRDQAQVPMAAVPEERARAYIARLEAGRRPDAPPREVDPEVLASLVSGAAEETPGEALVRSRGAAAGSLSLVDAQATLLAELARGRLWGFHPTPETLDRMAAVIEEGASPLVLSELHVAERERDLLARAAAEIFGEDLPARLAMRLEETAAVWSLTRVPMAAVDAALRVAAELRICPLADVLQMQLLQHDLGPELAAARERRHAGAEVGCEACAPPASGGPERSR